MSNSIDIFVQRFSQNKQEYLTAVLPFKYIDELSEVLVYKQDPDGYQRLPNRQHYLKIKNYISKYPNDYKFPTAIILGADKSIINSLASKDDCGEKIKLDTTNKKIFRIVDGQHRINGLREARINNPNIDNFSLVVIILLSDEEKKSIELEAFIDINSTAKRINTDLATLARFDYEIKENKINPGGDVRHVSMKTAYYLEENNSDSVWNSAIKFEIHSEVSLGIVGVSLFCESIDGLVDYYLKHKFQGFVNRLGQSRIEYYDLAAQEIAKDIDRVWNQNIRIKWSECFIKSLAKNEMEELKNIYYSNEYYIQKTLGTKVLNVLYTDIVKELGIGESAFENFKKIIQASKVTFKDWKRSGPFAGLSSESGFSKVRKMIRNEIAVPKT